MIEPRFWAVNYAENLLRNSSQESMHPSGKLLSHNRVGMPKVSANNLHWKHRRHQSNSVVYLLIAYVHHDLHFCHNQLLGWLLPRLWDPTFQILS